MEKSLEKSSGVYIWYSCMSSGLYQVKLEVCFLESLNLWGFRLEITKRGLCMTFKTQKQRSCHHCQAALVVRCSERQMPRGLQIPACSLLSQLHSCLFLPAADKLSSPTAAPVHHQTLSSALQKHEYTQRWQLSQILQQLPSVASRQLQPVLLHQCSGGLFSESSLIPVPSLGPGFFSVSQIHSGSYSLLFGGFASLIDPWLVPCSDPIPAVMFTILWLLAKQQPSASQILRNEDAHSQESCATFCAVIHVKVLPFTHQAVQWEVGEITKSLQGDEWYLRALRGLYDPCVYLLSQPLR